MGKRDNQPDTRYFDLYNLAPVGYCIIDEKGLILEANLTAAALLGVHQDALNQRPVVHFILPEDQNIYRRYTERLLETHSMSPRQVTESLACELRMVKADGAPIWVRLDGNIAQGENGTPVYRVALSDISERKQATEETQYSQELIRSLINSIPDIVFYKDIEGVYLGCNAEFARHLGRPAKEIIGKTDYDLYTKEEADAFRHNDRRMLEKGAPRHNEEWISYPNGHRVLIDTLKAPLFGLDGEILGIVGISRDITERKEIGEKYRALFNQSVSGIYLHDLEGNILDVNQMACLQSGYSKEELLELTIFDLHADHQGTANLPKDEVLRLWNQWQPEQIHTIDAEHKRKDGTIFPVEISTGVIRYGDRDRILAITQDITERKGAERERQRLLSQIQEEAQLVQQIMDTVPEGVLLLDAGGRVVLANPVAQRDLALLADATIGEQITHLGDRPLAELLAAPPKGLWHEVKTEKRTFETIARPMERSNESRHWVLVINDVTREREIQAQLQQQERLAAVGQLAAGISHDFNNIMAVIALYTQMGLQTPGLTGELHERLQIINEQTKRATGLIQQIVDFSRHTTLESYPMDLLPFIKEMIKLLQRTIPEHIKISFGYTKDAYVVSADPTRMQQMLTNLVINARDAMPEGGTLRVGLEQITIEPDQLPLSEMKAGKWIKLTVADTGIGIAPDALPHIFEPFFTTKEPGAGSGLGLAQVHGIVGLHDGYIDVVSQMGKGTTFTIYLPALTVELAEKTSADIPPPPRGEGQWILIVEDNGTLRNAIKETLEILDYQVLEATNGQEALAMMEECGEQVDLVLSDVVMPAMSGIALLHALRQKGWETPVILLTGHATGKDLDDLRRQGLATWLTKPLRLDQLAQAISRALHK